MSEMRVSAGKAMWLQGDASGPAAPVRPDAWLLELERARWQAQPRYDGAQEDASRAPLTELPDEPAHTVDTPQQNDRDAASSVDAAQDFAPHHAAGSMPASPKSGVSLRAAPDAASFAGMPQATALSTRRAAAFAAATPAATQPHSDPASTPWSSRSIHVHVGEQATNVWIRDARLQPHEALRLLEQLRPLVGYDLQAYAPVRLTVNGQPVDTKRRR